jgi:hypothetical protein
MLVLVLWTVWADGYSIAVSWPLATDKAAVDLDGPTPIFDIPLDVDNCGIVDKTANSDALSADIIFAGRVTLPSSFCFVASLAGADDTSEPVRTYKSADVGSTAIRRCS